MRRRLAILLVLLCALGTGTLAYAATVVLYPGAGVAGARLGALDSSAVSALKKAFVYSGKVTNRDYAQPVYEYRFGRILSTKHYPVEMYANKSHRVIIFEVNSPTCATTKGIKVGSTEAQLTAAYGTALKKRTTPTYFIYWSGSTSNRTDYYVSRATKKVARILISRY